MRDKVQFIAGSLLAPYFSDPSAARGQAIGMLSQTLAQRVDAAGYTDAVIILAAVLFVVLCGALLSRGRRRDRGQRPSRVALRAGMSAWKVPSQSPWSGFAAMVGLGGRHAPFAIAASLAVGLLASPASAAPDRVCSAPGLRRTARAS